jgi:hypothetical protein
MGDWESKIKKDRRYIGCRILDVKETDGPVWARQVPGELALWVCAIADVDRPGTGGFRARAGASASDPAVGPLRQVFIDGTQATRKFIDLDRARQAKIIHSLQGLRCRLTVSP